jgi:tellurite resistance protein TerC
MHVGVAVWLVTIAAFAGVLAVDLVIVGRRPRVPSPRESLLWIGAYVTLAIVFGIALGAIQDTTHSAQFFAGWLTEYSLSLDNLFVFILLLRSYRVPAQSQRYVLLMGIVLALVLRGVFILFGAEVIHRFQWVFYLFGAFLLWTAIKLLAQRSDDHDAQTPPDTALVRLARRTMPTAPDYDGVRLTVVRSGRRLATPLLVVMLAIGSTDLLFALDSIPAIFGLTREPYLVFVANGFALLGLVQLFFLMGGLLDRLVYLSVGLAAVLGFIGIKLVFEALASNNLPFVNGGEPVAWAPEVPIAVSLVVIGAILALTAAASVAKLRLDARR